MKVGDLVKTVEPLRRSAWREMSKPFTGIIIELKEPTDDQKTPQIFVMTDTGEIIKTRVSYNLLEVINEGW
jgi:hypothetical protein